MTLTDFATLSFDGSGLQRKPKLSSDRWEDGFLERFDADTFWLEAVATPDAVLLICPRLNSLKTEMKSARFALDGVSVKARLRYHDRHTVIALPCRGQPDRVSVRIGDWRGETPVHAPESAFDGRNVLVTLSKDNDPRWIEDWVRFHVRHHGADAVLFVDNGSAEYGPEQILPALEQPGIAVARVLQTDVPYGPRAKKPTPNAELYLQFCVLNALRHRFLSGARAVLNCDVDELVHCAEGSIFDKAVASRLGYVSFPGFWVHPEPGSEGWPSHARHSHRDDPRKGCPDKWCLVPSGPLRRFEWRQHTLENLPLPRLMRSNKAWFYHCRTITNGWKLQKRLTVRDGTVKDPDLTAALNAANLPVRYL